MTDTTRLKLPLLTAAQSQKHVTVNGALTILDLMAGIINVTNRTATTPAGGESDGTVYILGGAGTGAWAGFSANDLALKIDGGWRRVLPGTGMIASDANSGGGLYRYTGAAWSSMALFAGTFGTTDNALLRADGTGGLTAQGSVLIGDDSGNLTGVAALTMSGLLTLTGGQVGFPATAVPSADANTIDDYEEGLWTPALNFGGNAVGMTYATTPAGRYTKIGRTVFATGSLALSAKGSSTGAATVAGLPFISANDGILQSAPIGIATSMSAVSGAVLAVLAANANRLSLYQSSNGSASGLSHSNFGNASALTFSVVYDI